MRILQQSNSFFDHSVHINSRELHRRLRGELRECANPLFKRYHLINDDLRRLLEKSFIPVTTTGQDFLHRKADGCEGVLHFMRHLASQRLPTRQARDVDQPLLSRSEAVPPCR